MRVLAGGEGAVITDEQLDEIERSCKQFDGRLRPGAGDAGGSLGASFIIAKWGVTHVGLLITELRRLRGENGVSP